MARNDTLFTDRSLPLCTARFFYTPCRHVCRTLPDLDQQVYNGGQRVLPSDDSLQHRVSHLLPLHCTPSLALPIDNTVPCYVTPPDKLASTSIISHLAGSAMFKTLTPSSSPHLFLRQTGIHLHHVAPGSAALQDAQAGARGKDDDRILFEECYPGWGMHVSDISLWKRSVCCPNPNPNPNHNPNPNPLLIPGSASWALALNSVAPLLTCGAGRGLDHGLWN